MAISTLAVLLLVTFGLFALAAAAERWAVFGEDWNSLHKRHRNRMKGELNLADGYKDLDDAQLFVLASPESKQGLYFLQHLLLLGWCLYVAAHTIADYMDESMSLFGQLPTWFWVALAGLVILAAGILTRLRIKSIHEDIDFLRRERSWHSNRRRA